MKRSLCMILGTAVLTLGMYAASWGQTGLTPAEFSKLVAQDAEFIRKTLARPKLDSDKKSQRKIRIAALMIAHYAQSDFSRGNPQNPALATLRNNALALHKAVADGKFAEAKKWAGKLSAAAPVDAGVKIERVDLTKLEDYDTVMKQFSSGRLGGLGLEDALDEYSMLKENPGPAEVDKLLNYSRKLAMIGTLSAQYTPELGGNKTIEKWKGFARDMENNAHALAKAAASKNAEAISKASLKMADTCKNCHDVFR